MNPDFILFVARASLMAIPLYLCNSMALVFGGKKPIDFGKKFIDGKRLLGDGKTIRGTAAGIIIASAAALALSAIFPETALFLKANYAFYGTLLAIGAVAGDFIGSFLKRRRGIERGGSVFLLDQLGFVVCGLAFGYGIVQPTLLEAIFLLAFTMLAHVIGNRIAFLAKIKKVPW
ncbi:MAG: CDP-2,3-bis-(O-geranylgeranyl)-sn-glycerol synthase [Candidatus Diapherotrites archaeon]|nr:CDP-2,3-bis-(O-geranylgeranyl)-sn-glycerol synthase [Candidatus Diapherotrites archaeon]